MSGNSRGTDLIAEQAYTPDPETDAEGVDEKENTLADDPELREQEQSGPQKTWESRVHKKCGDLRQLFDLPAGESPIEDFHCALHKKILLQGRLYIFQRHICFYSNLFGFVKRKVIPLQDVTSISKRKHIGFPNSIEVVHDGKPHFFTSFLHRREAYSQMICAWRRCSPHAEHWVEASSSAGSRLSPGSSFSHQGSLASVASIPDFASLPLPEEDDMLESPEQSQQHQQASSSMGTSSRQRQGRSPNGIEPTSTTGGRKLRQRSVSWGARALRRNSSSLEAPETPFADADLQGSPEGADEARDRHPLQSSPAGEWAAEAGKPPPVASGMELLLDGNLDIHLEGFCHRFLADGATFLQQFHESRGDTQVKLSSWTRHSAFGHVRELHFSSPVKALIGPPQAECHQTQHYHMYRGPHLVLETSQMMPNIPFGDHFTVEARWDVRAVDHNPSQCHVTTHVSVPFSKSTWWKKQIEKGSIESCREAHADWLAKAQALLAGSQPNSPALAQRWGPSGPLNSAQVEVDELLEQLPVQHRQAVADVIRRASYSSLPSSSPRAPMLDFLDSNGRLSSDKIPHARLSKTTRFADAVFQQDPQLAGIMSGMSSGITTDAAPAQQDVFKLLLVPSRVSMLLILVGVVISLQVAILLGFVRPKQAQVLGSAQAVTRSEVSELQSQITIMQELMQNVSLALQQHGIRV